MTALNTRGVQVIDPILSTHAQGYRPAANVGYRLFPYVDVDSSSGQVLKFGKEAFVLYNTRRAPGGSTARVNYGYSGDRYALSQDALEAPVPREWMRDAAQVPGIDLGRRAVNLVMDNLTLVEEYESARIATTAANYDNNHKLTLAGNTKWSADTGKPVKDIRDGEEAVRSSCGMRPNTLVLSPGAWESARDNPNVLSYFKLLDGESVSLEMFARLVEKRVYVGDRMYADDDGGFRDVWGNYAVLAYVPDNPEGQERPSYGYTYRLRGHPMVETPYWDQGAKSWIYGGTYERQPQLTGMLAGFLFSNPK